MSQSLCILHSSGTWLFKWNGDICMDKTFIGTSEEVWCYALFRFSASSKTLSLPKASWGVTLQSSFSMCFVAFSFHYLLSPLPLCLNLLSINHPSTNTVALHSALHPRLLYSLFGGICLHLKLFPLSTCPSLTIRSLTEAPRHTFSVTSSVLSPSIPFHFLLQLLTFSTLLPPY